MQINVIHTMLALSVFVFSSSSVQADILFGGGLGAGSINYDETTKDPNPSFNSESAAGDAGFGIHSRFGYQGESFRSYFNWVGILGLGGLFGGDSSSASNLAIAHDFLVNTDSGLFQVFLGPHISYINMKNCYTERGLFSTASEEEKKAEHCESDGGLGFGGQLGFILQPGDHFNLELGYTYTWARGVETNETDAKGVNHNAKLNEFAYGYIGFNLIF